VDRLGVDYFGSVTSVDLNSCAKSDAELMYVGRFYRLETAELCNADLTDVGLVHLKGLSRLSALFLSGTRITDAGLEQFKGFWPNLSRLDVYRTAVTSGGGRRLEKAVPRLSVNR
jgi:hypothetical protein